MKRALSTIISLYPKSWRNRYQNEFEALLDDVPPTWRTVFDVFGGALKMQMKIWSPWKMVAGFAIVGLAGAGAYSLTIPNVYVSTAIVRIGDVGSAELATQIERVESRSNLTHVINEENLYKGERAHLPLEDVIERMKKDIRIAWVKSMTGDPVIAISFATADAAVAQRTTGHLTSQFIEAKVGTLLDPANLPVHPAGPKRPMIVVTGLAAGALAGLVFALFNRLKIWKMAGMLGIAGAVLLGAASFLLPERFSSTAVLAYRPAEQPQVKQMIDRVTSGASLHAIVGKFGLYPNDPRADRRLSEHLHIQHLQNARAITIQFDYPDRHVVQNVTWEVAKLLIKENWNFEVVDPASLPQNPVSPNRETAAGAGLVLGLAIATILGINERRLKRE